MKRILALTSTIPLIYACSALADQVISDDQIVLGNICTGSSECADGEVFGATDLKIKGTIPELQFFDSSNGDTTWTVTVDDTASGVINGFSIKDETHGQYPLVIAEDGESNTLYIGRFGNIGMGTNLPQTGLHVVDSKNTALRLEQDTSIGFEAHAWDIRTGNVGLSFVNIGTPGNVGSVVIENGAPFASLYLQDTGQVGVGTNSPYTTLHVVDNKVPTLRLEQDTSAGFESHTWDISASNFGLIFDEVGSPPDFPPMLIENGALNSSLHIANNGFVGMGTGTPEGKLHTRGDGVQLAYFESGDGQAVQVRFRTDSENRRFLAVNNANEVQTQMQFRDNSILFLGQNVAQEWLRVDATGITTGGPTCGSPCDLTFEPEVFTVPPIEERAMLMWENKYLPAIGPTSPDQPMNLTEKMGGIIHELEVAHIYIEDLHSRLAMQNAKISDLIKVNATLIDRLDALEAQ